MYEKGRISTKSDEKLRGEFWRKKTFAKKALKNKRGTNMKTSEREVLNTGGQTGERLLKECPKKDLQ